MKRTRRAFLTSACLGIFSSIQAKSLCDLTPIQPIGPFFKNTSLNQLSDMTNRGKAKGKIINIRGIVKNKKCIPYPYSKITIWQANTYGRYNHSNDQSKNINDENFSGYIKIKSNEKGYYKFTTVVPGSYQISKTIIRPPHIHILIETETKKKIITQLYFKNHPLNKKDFLFNKSKKNSLLELDLNINSNSKIINYDFVV